MKKRVCAAVLTVCGVLFSQGLFASSGYFEVGYKTKTVGLDSEDFFGLDLGGLLGESSVKYSGVGFAFGGDYHIAGPVSFWTDVNFGLFTDAECKVVVLGTEVAASADIRAYGLGAALGISCNIPVLPFLSLYASGGAAVDSLVDAGKEIWGDRFQVVSFGIRGKVAVRLNFGSAFALTAGVADTYTVLPLFCDVGSRSIVDDMSNINDFSVFLGFSYSK